MGPTRTWRGTRSCGAPRATRSGPGSSTSVTWRQPRSGWTRTTLSSGCARSAPTGSGARPCFRCRGARGASVLLHPEAGDDHRRLVARGVRRPQLDPVVTGAELLLGGPPEQPFDIAARLDPPLASVDLAPLPVVLALDDPLEQSVLG